MTRLWSGAADSAGGGGTGEAYFDVDDMNGFFFSAKILQIAYYLNVGL